MTKINLWYPHYIRDFKAKTAHLSLAARGAYRALIDEYWERQGPIPSDDREICRMIGAFPDEWEEIKKTVLAFFVEESTVNGTVNETVNITVYRHKRIDEELEIAKKQRNAKAARITKAREVRASKLENKQNNTENTVNDTVNSTVNNTVNESNTALLTGLPTPSPSPTPLATEERSICSPNSENVSRETIPKAENPEPDKHKPKAKAIKQTPRDILKPLLDPELAGHVVEHRAKLKKPLTAFAAKKLLAKFELCRDGPQAAAELMIEKGWAGFEPEWYENAKSISKNTSGGGCDPRGNDAGMVGFMQEMANHGADSVGGGASADGGQFSKPCRRANSEGPVIDLNATNADQ